MSTPQKRLSEISQVDQVISTYVQDAVLEQSGGGACSSRVEAHVAKGVGDGAEEAMPHEARGSVRAKKIQCFICKNMGLRLT